MSNNSKPPAYPQSGIASTCRSYEEYGAMFMLEELGERTIPLHTRLLNRSPILDVAGGASSFTAHLHSAGIPAVAVDPIYKGLTEEVIAAAYGEIEVSTGKLLALEEIYDWSYYGSPEQHRKLRVKSLDRFAEDFRSKDSASRYISAGLPRLPFEKHSFGLIICSHFLFLYAELLGEEFHKASLLELMRVLKPGGELRIYPILTLKWEAPSFLNRVLNEIEGISKTEYLRTGLPFIPGSRSLLRIVKEA